MKWYDVVAPIYDRVISRTYLPYRKLAVQELRLQPDFTILDIGCSTGLNFDPVRDGIGGQGILIGIDSSKNMLNRARKKVEHQNWANVHLLLADAGKLNRKQLEALVGRDVTIDSIICTLGFSVFPDWQAVFDRSFDLLRRGGRYCIMDLFNDKVTFRTRVVGILADSDNSRQVWEPLKKRCAGYFEKRYPARDGDVVVISSGTKP